MFDWVIADIAATTQAAVTAAPLKEQSRAGMANIVRTIAADTRVGRLLFSSQLSNAVVVRKRVGVRRADGDAAVPTRGHAGRAEQ